MIDRLCDAPRICVFGAGAVGGYVAAQLTLGGARVSVIARGDHLAAIRENGLRLTTPDVSAVVRVSASDDPNDVGPQDAVIVTVKAPALASVATSIYPLLGPTTPIVFLMNGFPWWYFHTLIKPKGVVDIQKLDDMAAPWLEIGADRAIGGVSYAACTVTAPGSVYVASPGRGIIIGEPGGEISPRVSMVADALRAGAVNVEVTNRIRDSVWVKLVSNLASGPMSILTQSAARDLYGEPACYEAIRRSRLEAAAIAHAMGADVAADAETLVAGFRKLSHKSSIVQDLERGRAMEIDVLYVIPLDIARCVGVSTPTLDLLVDLVKLRGRAAGLYV